MAKTEIGAIFGRWTIIGNGTTSDKKLCRCTCGTEKEVNVKNLLSGASKSCGCLGREKATDRCCKNIEGQKFGKLTALKPDWYTSPGGKVIKRWDCVCECGNHTYVSTHDLLSGHTRKCNKCGFGISPKVVYKRIYDAWRMMIQRCENPKAQAYKNYGARGICVCDEWHDYNTFLAWSLSHGYEDHLTIDRRDVNGNYEPDNCRWITDKEQNNNRRNNRLIEYRGETHTAIEWAEMMHIPYHALLYRLNNGWSLEDAFFKPLRNDKRRAS